MFKEEKIKAFQLHITTTHMHCSRQQWIRVIVRKYPFFPFLTSFLHNDAA